MADDRLMFRVLEMYYMQEQSQADIAKKMNVSRATISRIISKAKQNGYVTISIHHPDNTEHLIEEQLEEKYSLKEVIVAPSDIGDNVSDMVNYEVVQYLLRVIKNKMTLGITWGLTIGELVAYMKANSSMLQNFNQKDVTVLPVLGTAISREMDTRLQGNHASLYAMELAELFKGSAYQFPVPMYVSSPEIRKILLEDSMISHVFECMKHVDVALIPFGRLSEQSSIVKYGCMDEAEMKRLNDLGGCGEILGNFYTEEGTFLESELARRMIGIAREDLLRIPLRVGISYGEERIPAVKGALKNGLVNVLIIDHASAQALL